MKSNIVNNKWIRGAVPALLLHLCIGAVYCWSLLKGPIAESMQLPVGSIELAFMLAIFFLGMSAAFGGRLVEKNVKISSWTAAIFYIAGLVCTALSVQSGNPVNLFLSYGVLMGIGLGLGYLSPVKTLMLWFKDNKGLATGIAICGFGLSKAIFSPFIEWAVPKVGIVDTLYMMSAVSALSMGAAALLLKKPENWVEPKDDAFSLKAMFNDIKEPGVLKIWTLFFLNITCGLCIIGFEKNILSAAGILSVGLVSSLAAVFNASGRLVTATITDFMKKRKSAYLEIFLRSVFVCIAGAFFFGTDFFVLLLLFIVNFGYGGGFSSMPALLTEYYPMNKISTIHGYVLSAWAWASVASYFLMQLFVYQWNLDYQNIFVILAGLYFIGYLMTIWIKDRKETGVSETAVSDSNLKE